MKKLKRIASALLSVTMLTTVLAGSNFTLQADAASSYPTKLSTILNGWSGRLQTEQQKFPNGKYWNNYNASNNKNYSSTPCNHNRDGKTHCNQILMHNPINQNHTRIQYDLYDSICYCSQCAGFTRQLAQDIWGTVSFVQYRLEKSGNTNGYINYNYGGKKLYEPQIGDQVRLFSDSSGKQGHSIFITGISGNQITFADCNGDLNTCKIAWNKKTTLNYETNTTVSVTKSFLRNNAVYIERPIIQGDLNLNGKIDSNDYTLFQNSYIQNGNPITNASLTEYDINGDLRLGEEDLREMNTYINKSTADGYILGTGGSITFYDRRRVMSDCFLRNNGIYKKLDSSTVSFIGTFSVYTESFTVPSNAYNAAEGKSYKVTAIGNPSDRQPGSYISTLTSITIPSTVTTIKRFAFSDLNGANTTTVTFSGTPSLTTIEREAFYGCDKLTSLDLSKCNKLTSIGSQAFSLCPYLFVTFPYVASGSSQPTPTLGTSGSSYGAFFDVTRTSSTPLRTLFVNNTSSYRTIVLWDSDITMWRENKLSIMATGKVRIKDRNGNTIATKTSAQLEQISPR